MDQAKKMHSDLGRHTAQKNLAIVGIKKVYDIVDIGKGEGHHSCLINIIQMVHG